jgi:hypothetical protein
MKRKGRIYGAIIVAGFLAEMGGVRSYSQLSVSLEARPSQWWREWNLGVTASLIEQIKSMWVCGVYR